MNSIKMVIRINGAVLLLTPLSAVQAKSLVPNVTVLQAAGADQMEAGKDTGHPQVELDQLTDAGEPARNRHHKQRRKSSGSIFGCAGDAIPQSRGGSSV